MEGEEKKEEGRRTERGGKTVERQNTGMGKGGKEPGSEQGEGRETKEGRQERDTKKGGRGKDSACGHMARINYKCPDPTCLKQDASASALMRSSSVQHARVSLQNTCQ